MPCMAIAKGRDLQQHCELLNNWAAELLASLELTSGEGYGACVRCVRGFRGAQGVSKSSSGRRPRDR